MRFVGVSIGDVEYKIPVEEGQSLKEAAAAVGVHLDGQTVILNGVRLPDAQIPETKVYQNDTVELTGKTSAGLR